MKTLSCALVIACLALPARADVIEVDVTGTVAAHPWFTGPPAPTLSLIGQPFSVVWTLDTGCIGCFSGTLTINGNSIIFGHGLSDVFEVTAQQVYINTTIGPGQIALNTFIQSTGAVPFSSEFMPFTYTFNPATDNMTTPGQLGGGFISPGAVGYFDIDTMSLSNLSHPEYQVASVPGPLLGAGWPGIAAVGAFMAWWRKRKWTTA